MILDIQNVERSFGGIKALNGVSFGIEDNSIVGLIGPNGSGKSTLINVISGFLAPDSGSIHLNGRDISHMKPFEISSLGLCRTFQITRIFSAMTVLESMLLASRVQDDGLMSVFFRWKNVISQEKSDIEQAEEILDFLEISHLKHEYASTLSGGQQKLLNLGMVLMADPAVVLLDEPVAGVNPTLANKIFEKVVGEKKSRTFLVVEHIDMLMNFCDIIHVMNKGEIVASGAPEEIQNNEMVIDVYLGG